MSQDNSDLLRMIGQVRRAMPRNEPVMAICDALEARLIVRVAPSEPVKPKVDRRTYMRELMRRRRAAAKAERKD